MPGGHIYVYQGLLTKAENPDQLAGVIAHEMGHVAHRDGTRSVLQAAGLSLLFGTLLGDFVGGSAVVIAAKTMIQSSYSREVEMAADTFSVGVMRRAGGDARALGAAAHAHRRRSPPRHAPLARSSAGPGPRPQHQCRWRRRTHERPLLDPAQWAALQHICKDL